MSASEYVERFGALCRATFERGGVNMLRYGDACGSPGCLLGNYAGRRDLQDSFHLERHVILNKRNEYVGFRSIQDHFGIGGKDAFALFSSFGCAEAGTDPVLAVSFVRVFVSERFGSDPYPEAGPIPHWGGRAEAEALGRRWR